MEIGTAMMYFQNTEVGHEIFTYILGRYEKFPSAKTASTSKIIQVYMETVVLHSNAFTITGLFTKNLFQNEQVKILRTKACDNN